MTYKDPDYMKKWRARNKEKIRAYNKADHVERYAKTAHREKKILQAAERCRGVPAAHQFVSSTRVTYTACV